MKQLLKQIIPQKLLYDYRLHHINQNSKKSYSEIEEDISRRYFSETGKILKWENPTSYTEKLNFSKLYNVTDFKQKASDKLKVRELIIEKIDENHLIPLLGVYDSIEEMLSSLNSLPNEFVIKCNHDSGSTTVVRNKNQIDKRSLITKYHFYMKRRFAYDSYEMHYDGIKPKIIVEKYMSNPFDSELMDYKFLCFDGKPYYCWVDLNRYTNHKRNVYDLSWNLMPFNQHRYGNYSGIIPKPNNFEEMLDIATQLSKGIDHVRIDLYSIEDKTYFGEMTFTNGAGYEAITPDIWDEQLGRLWNLDVSKRLSKR